MRRCAAVLLLFGCASSGIDFAELPNAPIAFVYRTVEETDRMLDEAEARLAAEQPHPEDEFGIEVEGLAKLAGKRTYADVVRDWQGRVALFVAPTKSLEQPDVMQRGARPLDWDNGHERLMFASGSGASHLFEWIVATGEVRQLSSGPESEVDGCYGAAGAIVWEQPKIAAKPAAGSRIWLRRPGQAPHALTPGPADTEPACSPDGMRIVYGSSDPRTGMQLHWIDPELGTGGSLGAGRSAAFSPDGRWIVYAAPTPAGWRLRRMHADGSGKRSFGRSGFVESDPSFSPDGRFVVFSVNKAASPITRLFVRSFDSELDRQLEFAGSGLRPVW